MNALRFGGDIFWLSDGSLPWSSNRSNSVCVAFFMSSKKLPDRSNPPFSYYKLAPDPTGGWVMRSLGFDVMGDKAQPRFSRLSQEVAGRCRTTTRSVDLGHILCVLRPSLSWLITLNLDLS